MLHAVIMAGGSGTRFWPASRSGRPKQLLDLSAERTMIQATRTRLEGLVPAENTLIVTNHALTDEVARQLPEVPTSAILGEPCRRDTAPCIGLAAALLLRQDPAAFMVVLPADHVIQTTAQFQSAIRQAAALVRADPQQLVTFGVRPTYPAETYGYIERGEPWAATGGRGTPPATPRDEGSISPVYRARRFREKPSADVAQQYLASGNFYWNAGIFIWSAKTILAALRQHEPEMCDRVEHIAATYGSPNFYQVFSHEFNAIRSKSIDFAVMEHYPHILVLEVPFTWDDVGSWGSLARLRGMDEEGNTVVGRHVGVHTRDCIIRSSEEHLIATLGVQNCVIVHTPDATLVANRSDEESIRRVVELLRQKEWDQYL